MSVLIKGMEMPKNCEECDIHFCKLWMRMTIRQRIVGKHPDCPCIKVKTPHGRLIDADELMNKTFYNPLSPPYITKEIILEARIVVEAEGSR